MSSIQDNIARVRALDNAAVLDLWERIEQGTTGELAWEPGKAFEYLVLRAFELEGADVQWPYTVKLGEEVVEEIDGAVHAEGLACICESKDHTEKINVEPLAKLRNQLLRRPGGAIGLVFSRSGFSDAAVALARHFAPQTILLWNGHEVYFGMARRKMVAGLLAKYRHAVEQGLPDFDIRLLD